MNNQSSIERFFKSENWGLFLVKFIIFAVLAFMFWSVINIPYGKMLCEQVVSFERSRGMPILDVKYTDRHGLTMKVNFAPPDNSPAPLKEKKTAEVIIFPNTLHFNIIPLLGLLLAAPYRNRNRLIFFLIAGSLVLYASHLVHLHLNLVSYRHLKYQFIVDKMRMSPERYHQAIEYLYWMKLTTRLQSFMEQAGSMIVPLFIWMVYSQKWLFKSLLKRAKIRQMELEKKAQLKKQNQKEQQEQA